jgi:Cof subfamily protein (haloacid dehalogenase superfamily)
VRIRLLALDLDDTLLDGKGGVSAANRAAIDTARSNGVEVAVITGRMFQSAHPIALDLGLTAPLAAYQGSLICQMDGTVLYHHPMPVEAARRCLQWAEQNGVHANLYLNDTLYVAELNERALNYARHVNVTAHPVGKLSEFLHEPPTRIVYLAPHDLMDTWTPEILRSISPNLRAARSRPHLMEWIAGGIDKGVALKVMADHFGLALEETAAMGDSETDAPMIVAAGLGLAVRNSSPEALAAADMVTASNVNDGVAEAIRHILKLNEQSN